MTVSFMGTFFSNCKFNKYCPKTQTKFSTLIITIIAQYIHDVTCEFRIIILAFVNLNIIFRRGRRIQLSRHFTCPNCYVDTDVLEINRRDDFWWQKKSVFHRETVRLISIHSLTLIRVFIFTVSVFYILYL